MRAAVQHSPASSQPLPTVGELLRRGLRNAKRSSDELAEAVQVSREYLNDLMTGRRRPPLPARTDLYERMTSFLRLGRNDLATSALAERTRKSTTDVRGPAPDVARQVLELCEPATARELKRRRARRGDAELAGFTQRLLDVVQGSVRRTLDDQIGLKIAAADHGNSYVGMRVRLLTFLDVTPDTLTPADLAEFIAPRVSLWDVDLQADVLRVVLRAQEPRDSSRRRPTVRPGYRPQS
jgi:transcriptional regulator with XRE-family HTH domain